MKKRIFGLFLIALIVCAICTLFPNAARAASAELSGSCGESLRWVLRDEILTISGAGDMDEYGGKDFPPWWPQNGEEPLKFTSVVIEDGVSSIGEGAFYNCLYLKSVSLPASITYIGDGAFYNCLSLTELTIPGENVIIGDSAFFNCSGLKSVVCTGTLYKIGDSAFSMDGESFFEGRYEMMLSRVVVHGDGLEIGKRAFEYCVNLKDVTFPNGVSSVGLFAFSYCLQLDKPILNGLRKIENGAYFFCESLTEAALSDATESIEPGAFYSCKSLERVTLPVGITAINTMTFQECANLKSIRIFPDVETIAEDAFADCDSLETVYFAGSREEWEQIEVETGNDALKTAQILCAEDSSISYNLGYKEVYLYDSDFKNNAYVIPLEYGPFFPYEIQFTVNGEARTEWFMDENDSVTINDYTFRVGFAGTARSLAFVMDGERVIAYPWEKDFVDSARSQIRYAQKDNYHKTDLNVNLFGTLWNERKKVSIEPLPGNPDVWKAAGFYSNSEDSYESFSIHNDHYEYMGDNLELNLRLTDPGELILVIGSGYLGNPENIWYTVNFDLPYSYPRSVGAKVLEELQFLRFEAWDEDGETRREDETIQPFCSVADRKSYKTADCSLTLSDEQWNPKSDVTWLNMDFGTGELRGRTDLEVTVYDGSYASEEEAIRAGAENVTERIWRQKDMARSGGYPLYHDSEDISAQTHFTLVVKKNRQPIETVQVNFKIKLRRSYLLADNWLFEGNDIWRESVGGLFEGIGLDIDERFQHTVTYVLYDENVSLQGPYYVRARLVSCQGD